MFTTDRFFSQIWAGWLFFLMISVFSLAVEPKILIIPVVSIMLGLLYWCVTCAYCSERFSTYASLRLFFGLGFVPAIAFLAALATTLKQIKLDVYTSLLMSSVPLVVALFTYAVVQALPSKTISLRTRGKGVEILETSPPQTWCAGGAGAGLSGLLYPVFQNYNTSLGWLVLFLIFMSVFLTVYHRANIHAVKALRIREAKERTHYTFINVEEIRAIRAKSLLGRMFAIKSCE